jgi:tRNA-binding protein
MLKVSSKTGVIRAFMHREFSKVLMLKFSDQPVNSTLNMPDAVWLYNDKSELIGVNLLNTPFDYNGYAPLNDSLESYIEMKLSEYGLDIEIDQKSYFVSGKILNANLHPVSDHLHVCTVDIGEERINVVSGAKNVREDMHVVVALPKAVLPDGTMIAEGTVAGVVSQACCVHCQKLPVGKSRLRD